jgi:hypothetical protein
LLEATSERGGKRAELYRQDIEPFPTCKALRSTGEQGRALKTCRARRWLRSWEQPKPLFVFTSEIALLI